MFCRYLQGFRQFSFFLVVVCLSPTLLRGQVYTDGLSSAIEEVRKKHPTAIISACELIQAGYFVEHELNKCQDSMAQLSQNHEAGLASLENLQSMIDYLLQSNWLNDSAHRDAYLRDELAKYTTKTTKTKWNSETQKMEIVEESYKYNPPSLLGAFTSDYRGLFNWVGVGPDLLLMADRFVVDCRSSPEEVIAFLSKQYGNERIAFEADWKGWGEVNNFYRELREITEDESWMSKNCQPIRASETRANPAFFPKD